MAYVSATDDTAARLEVISPLVGRFLTGAEISERLNFDAGQVARRALTGAIPGARKIGRLWRFHAAPFEAWARGWWDGHGSFDEWLASQQPDVANP